MAAFDHKWRLNATFVHNLEFNKAGQLNHKSTKSLRYLAFSQLQKIEIFYNICPIVESNSTVFTNT